MSDLVDRLREAFQRVRYGGDGPYIPDGDLFDVAADAIDARDTRIAELTRALRRIYDLPDVHGDEACIIAREALAKEQPAP